MRAFVMAAVFLLLVGCTKTHMGDTAAAGLQATGGTLDIYAIDVEGGGATLFVGPTGESVLIDTGNLSAIPRDSGRIMEVVRAAGLSRIDHLITTHWHGDHMGNIAALAGLIPIGEFVDHGPNIQPAPAVDAFLRDTYPALIAKAKHTVVAPGDRLSVAGLDWRIVSAAAQPIDTPLPGAGVPNRLCPADFKPRQGPPEDKMSVASVITFGKFRTAQLGDLPMAGEFALMCPNTRLPPLDLFLLSTHGVLVANAPLMLHALHPRVAIMNNGTQKGGNVDTMMSVYTSPGLEDFWQLHISTLSGQEYSPPGLFTANIIDSPMDAIPVAPLASPDLVPQKPTPPIHNGKAYWIKISARADGSFTVTNTRNGFTKTYPVPAH